MVEAQETPQAPDRFNPKVTVNTCGIIQKDVTFFYFETFSFWYFQDPVFMVNYYKNAKKTGY